MKKIIIALVVGIIFTINANSANAESMLKNYFAYSITGKQLEEITPYFDNVVHTESTVKKMKGSPHTYYAVYKDEHYYIRLYPAHDNTNIYIVADSQYDKDENDLTELFKKHNLKYKKLEDDEALKEYKFDFVDYARTGNLDGLFTLPDYIKPLKTGMGKLNDKISKNSKNASALPYENDTQPINLTCINTEVYKNEAAGVTVTTNEYRLKNKQNKYVHAFEYVVKNNESSDIMINKVTSERIATMKDITSQTFVDLDRLDLADTVGSFPPVAICTCGASLAFTVANNVRLAKVAKESMRYAHSLPEKYNLKANSSMRILVLKFKNDPKPLNFNVTRNGQTHTFTY